MIGAEAGKSCAYLLGVYLGDGCVTRYNNGIAFRLNTIDQDFAEAVKKALGDLTTVPVRIWKETVSKSSKPNFALCCADEQLAQWLVCATEGKKTFPATKYPRELIVGLMDSEGFVAKVTRNHTGRAYYMGFKSCDIWVPELIGLMQSVGLKIGKISECPPYKPHYKTPTRFHIKMQSWVDSGMRFNIKRKQDRVDLWAATEPYTQRKRHPRKLTSETSTPEVRKD